MADAYRVVLACQSAEDEYADNLAAGCLLAYAHSRPSLRGLVQVSLERYKLRAGPGPAELAARIAAAAPRLVGFSCYVWNREYVREAIRRLKAVLPGALVVVGGPEASSSPADFLSDKLADLVVRGEGEATFAAILERLILGQDPRDVVGISILRDGELAHTGSAALLLELDGVPCPYQAGIFRYGPDFNGVVAIEISRGCPFKCSYCTWTERRRISYFPIERVLSTVRSILAASPRARFCFSDSNVLFDRDRSRVLFSGLRKLGERKPDAQWNFEIDMRSIGHIERETLRLVDSSQFIFGIGVQSLTPRALQLARRPADISKLERNIRILREEAPQACLVAELICGLPGDTLADYRRSIARVLEMPFDAFNFMPLIVQEGSRYRKDASALGIVFDPRPPHFLLSAPGFPAKDIEAARRLSYTVRFFMDKSSVRKALQAACRARPAGGSLVDICEELGRRLETAGIFSLSQAYSRFVWGVIHLDDGLTDATPEQRYDVLAAVYAYLHEATGGAVGQEGRFLIDEMAQLLWRRMVATPSFRSFLDHSVPAVDAGGGPLLICRQEDRDLAAGLGYEVMAAPPTANPEKSIPRDFTNYILLNSFHCFPDAQRQRLLKALAQRSEDGGHFVMIENVTSGNFSAENLVLDAACSGWTRLWGPRTKDARALPDGRVCRWLFFSGTKSGAGQASPAQRKRVLQKTTGRTTFLMLARSVRRPLQEAGRP